MSRQKTYSVEYIRMNKALHEAPRGYGGDGARHLEAILKLADKVKARSFLDYGAGQQKLSEAIKSVGGLNRFHQMQDYDPAILKISDPPRPADLVSCTDVLEHIEPEYLSNVLDELYKLTIKACYLEIATRPANKDLPDGRNTHLIIEDDHWWMDKLTNYDWKLDIARIYHPNKEPKLRAIVVTAIKGPSDE